MSAKSIRKHMRTNRNESQIAALSGQVRALAEVLELVLKRVQELELSVNPLKVENVGPATPAS